MVSGTIFGSSARTVDAILTAPTAAVTGGGSMTRRAEGFGLTSLAVDGQDVFAVWREEHLPPGLLEMAFEFARGHVPEKNAVLRSLGQFLAVRREREVGRPSRLTVDGVDFPPRRRVPEA